MTTMQQPTGPSSHHFVSQRLKLHYVDWGNAHKPPLLMVHGGLDHCRNWDWLAQAMREDYQVIAPDLRGHGDSAWEASGDYTKANYVADLAQLLRHLALGPVAIIAHSFGGMVSMAYAAAFPETVCRLAVIEGVLRSTQEIADKQATMPQRLAEWVGRLRDMAKRAPRRYATLDEACLRMIEANPRLTTAQARHLTVHGANRNEDGTYSWKYDNYFRVRSPLDFGAQEAIELWQSIRCPVLHLGGDESWIEDPAANGSLDYFTDGRSVMLKGAGHWVHHDRLDEVLGHLRPFLAA